MIRRPPRSTLDRSSAASDVYKRQLPLLDEHNGDAVANGVLHARFVAYEPAAAHQPQPVSYTHLRAHETVLDLVCRLLLATQHTKYQTTTH